VGAHPIHAAASPWHKTVQCIECHPVPTLSENDPCVPEHGNLVTDYEWGPAAKFGQYDADAKTCSLVWCHGGLSGQDPVGHETIRIPTWTLLDGTQTACGGGCHALPPAGMHPLQPVACELCHSQVMSEYNELNPAASIWADPNLHVDGLMQFHPLADAGVDAGVGGGGGSGGSGGSGA
jgi:predicted CxxxxCH...CXXCH cytochrome family protein